MSTFSPDTTFKLKALGIYQLVFAVITLGVTLWILLQTGFQFMQITGALVAVVLICLLGIYSGISCLKVNPRCLFFSSIYQCFQLVSFSIAGYGFRYDAGLSLNLMIDLTTNFTFGLKLELFSFWHFNFDMDADVILVNLNLVAVAVIVIIDNLKKLMKQEAEEELLSIGEEVQP